MYGSECWAWTGKHKRRVTAVEMRYLRGVCGYVRRDRVRNDLVYEECMIRKNVVERVRVSQFRWFGHLERMACERLVKRIYVSEIEGVRLRGCPACKWMDVINGVLRERKFKSGKNERACMNAIMNVDEAKVVCLDRNMCRRMILA